MIEKRGPKYRAKFHIGNGKRISKTFESREEASHWEKIMRAKKTLGQLSSEQLQESKSIVIYNDLVKKWYSTDADKLSPSTKRQYKACISRHFFPSLRAKNIKTITSDDCDKIFNEVKSSNLSASSINKALILLKQIFNFAVKRDLIDKNPARNLKNLKVQTSNDVFLSEPEIRLLLRKCEGKWYYGAILIALNTGMRIGEIAGLQWDMVDLDNKVIHVSRNLTKDGLNEFTKTHVKKNIPMTEASYDFLSKHKHSKLMAKYVIIDPKGKPIRPDHFTSRSLKKLTKGTVLEKYGFHSLRHTFASQFMMRGGNLYDLQKFLGHTKLEMTTRYAHLSPDHLHDKIKIVNFR